MGRKSKAKRIKRARLPADYERLPVAPPGYYSELPAVQVDRVARWISAGVSDSTRRAYSLAVRRWHMWAGALELRDGSLAAHLSHMADVGKAPATLALAVAGLRRYAEHLQVDDPYGPRSRAVMKGVRRDGKRGPGQVDGVRWRDLERAAVLAAEEGTLRGLRDAALLRLGSDCLLRISELAAVDCADVRAAEDGSGRLRVPRSKTDQEGEGVVLYFGAPTAAAVDAWRQAARITSGPLFVRVWAVGPSNSADMSNPVGVTALHADALRRVIQERARRAGIRGRVSGHSLRVGSAQELAARGAGMPELLTAGRWKSEAVAAKYVEGESAARGAVARLRYGAGGKARRSHVVA